MPSGRTGLLSGHLCLRCGSAVMTSLMRTGLSGAFPAASHLIGDPQTQSIQKARAAHARVQRANVLSQQADRLLGESERLIAEAQDLLQDAPGDE